MYDLSLVKLNILGFGGYKRKLRRFIIIKMRTIPLLVLASLALAASAKFDFRRAKAFLRQEIVKPAPAIEEVPVAPHSTLLDDNSTLVYSVQAFRGLMIGLDTGLYPSVHEHELCLNDLVYSKVARVAMFLTTFELKYLETMVQDVTEIAQNLQYCGIHQYNDLLAYYLANPQKCQYAAIAEAFAWNAISVTRKIEDAKELVYGTEFPAHTGSEIYKQVFRLGFDGGSLVRVLTGF